MQSACEWWQEGDLPMRWANLTTEWCTDFHTVEGLWLTLLLSTMESHTSRSIEQLFFQTPKKQQTDWVQAISLLLGSARKRPLWPTTVGDLWDRTVSAWLGPHYRFLHEVLLFWLHRICLNKYSSTPALPLPLNCYNYITRQTGAKIPAHLILEALIVECLN